MMFSNHDNNFLFGGAGFLDAGDDVVDGRTEIIRVCAQVNDCGARVTRSRGGLMLLGCGFVVHVSLFMA